MITWGFRDQAPFELKMLYQRLQEKLGYIFGDRSILIQSLTHTSFGNESLIHQNAAYRDNERLEFLGDAILNLIISDILLGVLPTSTEGQLSKIRAAVVNERTLAQVAEGIDLHECVRLGKGELQSGGARKASILANTLEAVIAAVYLDGGYQAVFPVVRNLFKPLFSEGLGLMVCFDHKTQLQELTQSRFKIIPSYHLVSTTGPDHQKTFEVEVRMNGERIGTAQGGSKKEAEQNAARTAIETLGYTL